MEAGNLENECADVGESPCIADGSLAGFANVDHPVGSIENVLDVRAIHQDSGNCAMALNKRALVTKKGAAQGDLRDVYLVSPNHQEGPRMFPVGVGAEDGIAHSLGA